MSDKKNKDEKPKMEFSKRLVIWALSITTICIAVSYVLAFLDHDACGDITVAVVTTCIAIAVSYEAKSYGEKNSRNKYGIDESGNRKAAACNNDAGMHAKDESALG